MIFKVPKKEIFYLKMFKLYKLAFISTSHLYSLLRNISTSSRDVAIIDMIEIATTSDALKELAYLVIYNI